MLKLTRKLSCPQAPDNNNNGHQAVPTRNAMGRQQYHQPPPQLFGSAMSLGGTAGSSRPDGPPCTVVAATNGCQSSVAGSTLTGPGDTVSTTSHRWVQTPTNGGATVTARPPHNVNNDLDSHDDSGMLWSDDPESEYFQYVLRQEQKARAQQGKSAEGSLVGDRTISEIQNHDKKSLSLPVPFALEGQSVTTFDLADLSSGRHKHPSLKPQHVVPQRTPPDSVLPNNIFFLPNAPSTIDSREQDPSRTEKATTHAKKPRTFIILMAALLCLIVAAIIAAILLSTTVQLNQHSTTQSSGAAIHDVPASNFPTAAPSQKQTRVPSGVEDGRPLSTRPSLRPSPDAAFPTTQSDNNSAALEGDRSTYCGCRECTAVELSGIDCLARINYLMTAIDWSEEQACRQISGKEYPMECSDAKCNPDRCDRETAVMTSMPSVVATVPVLTPFPTSAPDTQPPTTSNPTIRLPTGGPTRPPITAHPTYPPTTRRPTDTPTSASPSLQPTTARPTDKNPVTARPTPPPIRVSDRLDLRLANDFPLRRCEGDCDSDNDCQQGLICYQSEWSDSSTIPPGCTAGDALWEEGHDFCVPTLRPASASDQLDLRFGLSFPLRQCEGDCDVDDDCREGLICFQRERGGPVPGCHLGGNPDALEETRTDFCVPEGIP